MEILIEYAHSYKYDLKKEILTVTNISKPSVEIPFKLSKEERAGIVGKYYKLSIDNIIDIDKEMGKIYIEDECKLMPKLYTVLHIKSQYHFQQIQIDTDCDNFYFSNYKKAARVKKFIKYVYEILNSKEEIKHAPKSDMIYL